MTQWHGLVNSATRERHRHLVPPAHADTHIQALCTSPSPGEIDSRMTLSSWLSHDNPTTVPNYDLPPIPDLDRTHHWKGGVGGGGWKGGKGNPHAALSALTLLAFLFFLNILQSCLRDTIGQNNGMMVMVLPANATATTRSKREVNIDRGSHGEDSHTTTHQNWTDLDDAAIRQHVDIALQNSWVSANQ